MVYTIEYSIVLKKVVRVNEKSGGFLGVPWSIVYTMVYTIEYSTVLGAVYTTCTNPHTIPSTICIQSR
jgi:hypothetical protein